VLQPDRAPGAWQRQSAPQGTAIRRQPSHTMALTA